VPALRLPAACDERACADLARGRHVAAASRTRRMRRRGEADDVRRVAEDAAAPSGSARAAPATRLNVARLSRPRAPVAQGIERCPAEAEVACSNHAGRMAQPTGVRAALRTLVAWNRDAQWAWTSWWAISWSMPPLCACCPCSSAIDDRSSSAVGRHALQVHRTRLGGRGDAGGRAGRRWFVLRGARGGS
jgi:hypothetical protein